MILFYFTWIFTCIFFSATKIRQPSDPPLPKQATYYFQRLYLAPLFLQKIARYIGDRSICNNHGRRFRNCHYHRYSNHSNHSNHRKYCRYFNYFKYCKFCHYSLQSIASLFLLLLFLFSLFLFVFLVIITGTVITTGSSFSLHG